jgi:hypothetical protein
MHFQNKMVDSHGTRKHYYFLRVAIKHAISHVRGGNIDLPTMYLVGMNFTTFQGKRCSCHTVPRPLALCWVNVVMTFRGKVRPSQPG